MYFFSASANELSFNPQSIEHAYLTILSNDLEIAKSIFKQIDSPRAKWGIVLISILNGYLEKFPSYFDIRNFLEIDLDFLIKNEKTDYIEQVLGSLEVLSEINQEVYKYVARVMYENKFYNVAFEYLEKSKKIFYRDPEMHFMLAKFYIDKFDYPSAKEHIEECLNIIPDYFPARKMLEKILLHLA